MENLNIAEMSRDELARLVAEKSDMLDLDVLKQALDRIDMLDGKEKTEAESTIADIKYKVITLCGSTRFKDAFFEAQKRLTLEGNIVISVGLFGHSGDDEVWTEGTKEMLDDMHKRKIDMADEIFVINVGGYIGSSTRSEIEYAIATGKPVNYLEPMS